MHSKRQMLEDIFKVSLPCNDRGNVDIATARPALEELALKSWQNHLGEERIEISTWTCCSPTAMTVLDSHNSIPYLGATFVVLPRANFDLVPCQYGPLLLIHSHSLYAAGSLSPEFTSLVLYFC